MSNHFIVHGALGKKDTEDGPLLSGVVLNIDKNITFD
jgi:hypothetical protein